jgi:BirA family transcriptional regulator, biotin operon repressor / biotin---[acetyl-CoA-carboxylase] ligase
LLNTRRIALLDVNLFEKLLKTRWLARNVSYFEEYPSTNSYAKAHRNGLTHGSLIITDHQTNGRGQFNREWKTRRGENLTFSVLLKKLNNSKLHTITLLSGLACIEVIESHTGETVFMKWPNDIVHQHKKLAGILVESSFIGDKPDSVIIGIGINVNQIEFPADLNDAISMALMSNGSTSHSREQLLADLLYRLEQRVETWQLKPDCIRAEVNSKLIGFGEYGHVQVNGEKMLERVKFVGVNSACYPVFVTSDGDIKQFTYQQVRFHPE